MNLAIKPQKAQQLLRPLHRCQVLSGNMVKTIAVCSMVVDHFSKIVLQWMTCNGWFDGPHFQAIDYFIRFKLYAIGTIAFPLFAFLLSEGFIHSQHQKRYFALMAVFAALSELPFDAAFFSWQPTTPEGSEVFYWGYQNVFFTLLLGLCSLWLIEKARSLPISTRNKWASRLLLIPCIAGPALTASLIHSDYESYGIVLIAGFYLFRRSRWQQAVAGIVIYMVCTGNQPPMCTLISYLIILLYNGNRGTWHLKYFFYSFYPAHLTVFYCVIRLLPYVIG